MKLSDLIGAPVLSPAGEWLGYAKSAYLCQNLHSLACLVCADGDEEEFLLPAHTLLSVGDAVIAGSARVKAPVGVPSPVGKPVYNAQGDYLGVGAEFITGENSVLFVAGQGSVIVFPAEFLTVNETVIVYSDPSEKPSVRRKSAPRARKTQKSPSVSAEAASTEKVSTPSADPATVPKSIYPFNLLGKQVRESVSDADGAPLVGAGETITPEILSRARRNHCLLALAANTLTV